MRQVKLATDFLFHKTILYIIILIQFTAAFVLLHMCVGIYNRGRYYLDIMAPLQQENLLYYTPASYHDDYTVHPYLDMGEIALCKVYESSVIDRNTLVQRIVAYDDMILDTIQLPLKKGVWEKTVGEDGAIPVVINEELEGYRLGQTLTFYDNEGGEIRLRITGVLQLSQVLRFSAGGSGTCFQDLFKDIDKNTPIFSTYSHNVEGKNIAMTTDPNRLYLYDSPEAMQNGRDTLVDRGQTSSFQEIYDRTSDEFHLRLRVLVPYFLCAFLVSLIGLVGTSVLNVLQNLRNFSIYYLVGGTWQACTGVLFLSDLFVLCLIVLFGSIILYNIAPSMDLLWGLDNLLMSLLFAALALGIPVSIPLYHMKKYSPIMILTKNRN